MLASTRRARPPMPSSAVPRRAASRRCRDPAAAPRTGRATSEAALQPPFLLADQGPLAERRGPAGRYAGIPCPSSERCPSGLRSATGNRVRAERCVAGSNPALSVPDMPGDDPGHVCLVVDARDELAAAQHLLRGAGEAHVVAGVAREQDLVPGRDAF